MVIRKLLFLAVVAAVCATGFARTSKEVDKEISKLNKQVEKLKKEQRDLKKKPTVKYTETHSHTGNVIKKIGGSVEINKRFECGYSKGVYHERVWSREHGWRDSVCNKCKTKYYEWKEYNGQIGESKKVLDRIEEINGEIENLKDEISELRQERAELVREERAAKLEAQQESASKTKSGKKSKAKASEEPEPEEED